MIDLVKNIKFMRAWKFRNDFEYDTLGYTEIDGLDKVEVKVLDGKNTEKISEPTVKVREVDNTEGMVFYPRCVIRNNWINAFEKRRKNWKHWLWFFKKSC